MILTKMLIEATIYSLFPDEYDYLTCIMLIPFTFIVDIILIIPEIIAILLYKKIEKE